MNGEMMGHISQWEMVQTLTELQALALCAVVDARYIDMTVEELNREASTNLSRKDQEIEESARRVSAAFKLNEDAQVRITSLEMALVEAEADKKRLESGKVEAEEANVDLRDEVAYLKNEADELLAIYEKIGRDQFRNIVAQIQHFNPGVTLALEDLSAEKVFHNGELILVQDLSPEDSRDALGAAQTLEAGRVES